MNLILAAFMFGCGGGGSGNSGAGSSGSSPRTIQGKSGLTLLYGSSESRVPTDLSAATISALSPSGNTYTTTSGIGLADGTFSIPGVPVGSCFVKVQPASGFPTFYQVDGASLELESSTLGDPAVSLASQNNTYLVLDPAAPGMIVSSFDLVSVKSGMIQAVASSGAGTPVSWRGKPLLDSSRETDLIITGLNSAVTPAGDTYRFITGYDKSFIGPFSMLDGATTTVAANLIIQGTPSAAFASVDRDAYCGTPLSSSPARSPNLTTSWVAQPLGVTHGPLGQARLLTHTTTTLTGLLDTGSLAFGDPFPASWTRVLRVDFSNPVPVTPPGNTSPIYFLTTVTSQWRASEIPASGAIKPIVGPGLNYKVNGLSLMQPQSGVGVTPYLSWGPPAIGSPAYYMVTIFNLTRQSSVAIFLTTRTSLQIPPQLLITGESYLFWLSTTSWPGFDLSKPKSVSWPYGRASLISETVVP